MYRDPRDPRFSAFVLERGQSPSLETATQFARGYIEACSSPLGLEVDALICKGIGGHLHMATITKSGFYLGDRACSAVNIELASIVVIPPKRNRKEEKIMWELLVDGKYLKALCIPGLALIFLCFICSL